LTFEKNNLIFEYRIIPWVLGINPLIINLLKTSAYGTDYTPKKQCKFDVYTNKQTNKQTNI
jgi:hypothetical protein